MAKDLTPDAIDILKTLVAFDTTSRGSNLALIEWVETYLDRLGVSHRRVPNAEGNKSNLIATLGPEAEGGVILSGHTDVVPVDGQAWNSDPWALTLRDGKLYGRGASDMKGFLALALAAAPELANGRSVRPVHLAFSYDEEIGCFGAPSMIEVIRREVPSPALAVVGEPTGMVAVNGHKGVATYTVTVSGREAHSSNPPQGVSAIMEAVPLMASLRRLADDLERAADPDSPFTPKGPTLTIGVVNGGTAGNILARECRFLFDLRWPPGPDAEEILRPFFAEVQALDAALKARAPEAGCSVVRRSLTPPLAPERAGAAESLVRRLAGDNGPPRAVSFAAEAGQFQEAGFSTVMCGPGYIDHAHQPDEFVEVSQMERGAGFMRRLIEWAQSPAP